MAKLELPPFEAISARVDGDGGAVLHLTLNRPEVRNAMSLRMVATPSPRRIATAA